MEWSGAQCLDQSLARGTGESEVFQEILWSWAPQAGWSLGEARNTGSQLAFDSQTQRYCPGTKLLLKRPQGTQSAPPPFFLCSLRVPVFLKGMYKGVVLTSFPPLNPSLKS